MKVGNLAVYTPDTTDFSRQGLGILSDVLSCFVTETAADNGNISYELEMTYTISGALVKELRKKTNLIKASTGPRDEDWMVFEIYDSVDDSAGTIKVYGQALPYRMLKFPFDNGGVFEKYDDVDGALKAAMAVITGFPSWFKISSDIKTKLDFSKSQVENLGAFIDFVLNNASGYVTYGWNYITINKDRGTQITDLVLRDDQNVQGVQVTADFSGLTNKIVPLLRARDASGEYTNEPDYVGTIVTSKDPFKWIKYWSGKAAKFDGQDIADNYFTKEKADEPKITASVTPVLVEEDVSQVMMIDQIVVYASAIDYQDTLKVVERKYNSLINEVVDFKLGDVKKDLIDSNNSTLNQIGDKVDTAVDNSQHALTSSDGKNTNYYGGDTAPEKPINGDTWYHLDSNGDPVIEQYIDGEWVVIAGDLLNEKVNEAIDQAQKDADAAKEAADKAANDALQAVEDAGFAKGRAEKAVTDAANAFIEAQKALEEANGVSSDLKQVEIGVDTLSNQITLKADQTIVDAINKQVNQNTGAIDVMSDRIDLTVSKTELEQKLEGYATETWTQGQIKVASDSINLNVSKVDSKVDNLNTSDRNLLIKSGTFETGLASDVTVSNNTYGGNRILMIPKSPADNTTHDPYIPIPSVDMVGTEYVLSFYLKADVNGDKFAVNLFSPNTVTYAINSQGIVTNTPTGGDGYSWFTATNTWVRYWVKYTQTSTNAKKKLIIGRTGTETIGKDNKGGFQLASPMLSEGNMTNKPWAAAPEDFATDTKFANLEITVNGIQGTVQNKADLSQVTQLANQITSVVGSTSNPNLVPYSGHPKDATGWNGTAGKLQIVTHGFYENGGATLFRLNNDSATAETTTGSYRFPVKEDKKYTISGLFFAGDNVVSSDIWFLSRPSGSSSNYTVSVKVAGDQKFSPSKAEYKTYTFTMPHGVNEGYIRFDNNGSTNAPSTSSMFFAELKMELGDHATPWLFDDSQSQITQMKDDINLRVQKDDVINQINISPESILIAGQKVHITGQTTIDNAVIKDAMIGDIKADHLTSGYIDAQKVWIYNLDVTNIVGDTAHFVQTEWNWLSKYTKIDADGVKIGDGISTLVLGKTGMHIYDDYKGEDVGWINGNHMRGEDSFNGLSNSLNKMGDYITWCSRDDDVSDYNMQMTYVKKDHGSLFTKGLNISDSLRAGRLISPEWKESPTSRRSLFTTTDLYGGAWLPTLKGLNDVNASGLSFGGSGIYYTNNGTFKNLTNLFSKLAGLGTVYIPETVNAGGTIGSYYKITL